MFWYWFTLASIIPALYGAWGFAAIVFLFGCWMCARVK